jgi:hypothetical protein
MIARFVGGPLDGRDIPMPDDLDGPPRLEQLPAGIEGSGIYRLDPDRTWGPSAEALGIEVPELDDEIADSWTDAEWEEFDRREAEALAKVEELHAFARTYINGEHVVFYRYVADMNSLRW